MYVPSNQAQDEHRSVVTAFRLEVKALARVLLYKFGPPEILIVLLLSMYV